MSKKTFHLLVEEEYGFRYWLWDTGLSKQEFRDFWEGLPSTKPAYLNPSKSGWPTGQGGWKQMVCATTEEVGFLVKCIEDFQNTKEPVAFLHLHRDWDSCLYIDGKEVHHDGYIHFEPSPEEQCYVH